MDQSAVLAIASFVRNRSELKARKGLFQDKPTDFFRYKRFVRCLKSDAYKKKSLKQPDLYPPLPEDEEKFAELARGIFVEFIKNQLVVPGQKLHSYECKEHGLKPSKDYPHLIMSTKATLDDNEYYLWHYNPKTLTDYLIVFGVIGVILAFVCYPLWPASMRRGKYYLSLAAFGFLGVFFGVAIIRLIVFLISMLFIREKGGFWLFPNLFEDCGFFDSFKPLYGFGDKETYTYIKKMKKQKKRQAKKEKLKKLKDKAN